MPNDRVLLHNIIQLTILSKYMHLLLVLRRDFNHNPGGDVVQLRNTEAALQSMGVKVQTVHDISEADLSDVDVIQVFNLGRPQEIMPWLRTGLPVFVFTIWVDFHEMECMASGAIRRILAKVFGRFGLEYVKVWARWVKGQTGFPGWHYARLGHRRSMQYVIDAATGLMASTHSEVKRLGGHFNLNKAIHVNPLGVSALFFNQRSQPGKGIVFGGYLEPRKNVLSLIRVCNRKQWTLHIFGKASAQNTTYEHQCRKEAGNTVHFHGHVSQEQYAAALSSCRVVALPSWFETTGLAALEGAVMGKGVVIGNKGDTKDVFGPYACYVDPLNEMELEMCLEAQLSQEANEQQLAFFSRYNYRNHCEKLLKAYEQKI